VNRNVRLLVEKGVITHEDGSPAAPIHGACSCWPPRRRSRWWPPSPCSTGYFGSAAFGTITGISSMVVMFGMVGGSIIAGVLADHTGAALGSVFFVLARRPSPPRRA